MPTPLKLLLLEDNPSDVELLLAELRRAGFDPEWKRVDTEADFQVALDPALDLILADYGLPQFTGFQALEWLKRSGLEIPFILVSGTIGEELAVEAIRRGAADYLLKDRLQRLGPAVLNVLEHGRMRNAKREADEALSASARRLHALLVNSADGITLLDAQGRVLWDSPAARGMLGYSAEEWIGKDAFQLVHPDDMPMVGEVLKSLVEAPEARVARTFRVRSQNGSWLWVDAVASNFLAVPAVQAIIVNYRDVTARKRAEEQVAASEAQLSALFAAMTDVVVVYDREGRYLQIAPTNPANLYLPSQAMLGRRVHEIFPKELADFFVRHIEEVLQTGRASQCEYSLPIQGKEVWFAASAAQLSESSVVWVAHDITNRKQAEVQTKEQLQRLASLHSIDVATRGFVDIGLILQVVLDHTMAQLGADAADFLLLNPVTQTLDYSKAAGFRTQALQHTRLPLGHGYAGRAALERQLVHVSELRGRATDFLRSPLFAQEDFVSYYGVPLVAKGVLKGVLEVFHRRPFDADAAWTDFLESLAGHAAVAIDSVSQFEEAQRSNMQLVIAYDATIEGWSHALDLRDKETEGHTQRVTALTLDLARSLGVSDSDLVQIRRGALLHDIGKMGVPDGILLKPGPLTDEEWVAMKKHPRFAYDMLSPIQYLHAALDIPYCHHEKWDGSGYPRGLAGEDIPLAARIFSVVDVWDALTSDRPYRPRWTRERAIEYIRAQSGTDFDPRVVEEFIAREPWRSAA
jgi:PAS domain S-box-containing protein/putative nucleotidyltransferase with HDIG domain